MYSAWGSASSSFLTTQNPKMLSMFGRWRLDLRDPFANRPSARGATLFPAHCVAGLQRDGARRFRSASDRKGLRHFIRMINKTRWSAPRSPHPARSQGGEEKAAGAECATGTEARKCGPLIHAVYPGLRPEGNWLFWMLRWIALP